MRDPILYDLDHSLHQRPLKLVEVILLLVRNLVYIETKAPSELSPWEICNSFLFQMNLGTLRLIELHSRARQSQRKFLKTSPTLCSIQLNFRNKIKILPSIGFSHYITELNSRREDG